MIIDTDYDAPMQTVPITDPAAVEWLERLAKNVPADIELGEVLSATFDPQAYAMRFLTTAGTFFSFHAHAERLVRLGEGDEQMSELASWCGGRETQRTARRSSDLERLTA